MTNKAVAIYVAFTLAGTGLSDAFANERTLEEIAQGKAVVALSACHSDDQCVVVWGGCTDVAINKLHMPLVQVPAGACTRSLPHNPKAVARCSIYGQCYVNVPHAQTRHEEWYVCQNDSECVIVAGNCDVEWAANRAFAELTHLSSPRADMPCTKPLESHPANTVASCQNHKCALSPPGFYAGGTPIPTVSFGHDRISREEKGTCEQVTGKECMFDLCQSSEGDTSSPPPCAPGWKPLH